MNQLPKLIVVEGTTASGKSDFGVELARMFDGEIISADCRQVFRGYDLGSGKITEEETKGVPHHLIDVVSSNEFFSMHDFQRLAYEAIEDIRARGKVPFIVGGTGLYIASVTDGYVMNACMPDLAYRDELEKLTTPQLYQMLMELAPQIEVDPKNRNRVMRFLEKLHDGVELEARKEPRYNCLKLGMTWEREILKQRIDIRLEKRMQMGMVDEVRRLLAEGATVEFMMKLGLEYRFITQYITDKFATEEEMCDQLSLAIKRFAKRQMTWFRRDKEIHWLNMGGDPLQEASELVRHFLNN